MSTDFSSSDPNVPTLWGDGRSYQRVALRNMVVHMSVGIAPWERKPGVKQRVLVSVEMFRYFDKHVGNDIASCINYDPIHETVTSKWPERAHTDLLETLGEELVELCFTDPKVAACRVSLQKPDVYDDTEAAIVEFYRVRAPAR